MSSRRDLKFLKYRELYNKGVEDYTSSYKPNKRTMKGLNAMIKYDRKLQKLNKKSIRR